MPADLVLIDCHIRTFDARRPFATALAVTDGVITAVGDPEDVRHDCDARTTVLSGRNWHVTPGLIDGHSHLFTWITAMQGVNLDRVANLDEVRRRLRAERLRIGPEAWLTGYALEYAAFEGQAYDHELLDEAAGPGPMLIHALDLHTAFANAEALTRAGVTGPRQFDDGSHIVCRADGTPTGELREPTAVRAVWDVAPSPTASQVRAWELEVMRLHHEVGITGIHQMDGWANTLSTLADLEAADELTLRVWLHSWVDPSDDADTIEEILGRRAMGGRRWRADGVKFMLDGVIDTGTAWLEEPDTHGEGLEPMWPEPEAFRRLLSRFDGAGFRIATHAIGDRAVREVLDAYQSLASGNEHRIEHVETAPASTVARFGRQKVTASMQPIHLRWLSPTFADPWSQRLGPGRCSHSYPSGDIAALGGNVVLGSDWPVAPFDPRLGLFAAQRRYAPDADDRVSIGPDRGLSALDALAGYTVNPGRLEGGGGGVLEVGAPADLVAWADDPAECTPEDIVDLPVLLTVAGGRVVHRATDAG